MRKDYVIFGGNFDPPHIGHIQIVKELLKRNYIPKLVVHAYRKNNFLCPKTRAIILKNIFPELSVEIYEEKSFLKYLEKNNFPVFVLGSDAYNSLDSWVNFEKYRDKIFKVILVVRSKKLESIKLKEFNNVEIIDTIFIPINKKFIPSSTFAREKLLKYFVEVVAKNPSFLKK